MGVSVTFQTSAVVSGRRERPTAVRRSRVGHRRARVRLAVPREAAPSRRGGQMRPGTGSHGSLRPTFRTAGLYLPRGTVSRSIQSREMNGPAERSRKLTPQRRQGQCPTIELALLSCPHDYRGDARNPPLPHGPEAGSTTRCRGGHSPGLRSLPAAIPHSRRVSHLLLIRRGGTSRGMHEHQAASLSAAVVITCLDAPTDRQV